MDKRHILTDGKGVVIQDITTARTTEEVEAQWCGVREERTAILVSCDWTQFGDAPVSDVKQEEWRVYRQSLRDITEQEDPFNVTWPAEPI